MSSVIHILLRPSVRCLIINEDEYHSLKQTYCFLCDLIDPKKYPNIPKKIRTNASLCLRNYPIREDLKDIAEAVGFWNPR